MELVDLIRNEELIYFVGSHAPFSLADIKGTLRGDVFADPKTHPYPGRRIEFPGQNICLPVVNQRDSTDEITDPKTGDVHLVVDKNFVKDGAVFRLRQFGDIYGSLRIENFPTLRGFCGYINDSNEQLVYRIKHMDKFIAIGSVKLHRLEIGYRILDSDDVIIADITNLSYWANNVTLGFRNAESLDDNTLLWCLCTATAILLGYDFIKRRYY